MTELYDFQKKVFNSAYEALNRFGFYALFLDMGCISGDAIVSINRGGITRKYKLKDAYEKFHGVSKKKNWNKTTYKPGYSYPFPLLPGYPPKCF